MMGKYLESFPKTPQLSVRTQQQQLETLENLIIQHPKLCKVKDTRAMKISTTHEVLVPL